MGRPVDQPSVDPLRMAPERMSSLGLGIGHPLLPARTAGPRRSTGHRTQTRVPRFWPGARSRPDDGIEDKGIVFCSEAALPSRTAGCPSFQSGTDRLLSHPTSQDFASSNSSFEKCLASISKARLPIWTAISCQPASPTTAARSTRLAWPRTRWK